MSLLKRKKMSEKAVKVKNRKKIIRTGTGVLFLAAVLAVIVLMYMELKKLTNQIAYMQDTTNIILSDVNGMQSGIEQTLRKEASIVESYSIDIIDMDFLSRTYDVEVAAVPKEYTSKTRMSIYFGTTECVLKPDGYAYTGTISLPLEKSFDGNITFLLANGKKKTTEVIEDYDGLQTHLDGVLSGSIEDVPDYKGGGISLDDTVCRFQLEGFDKYKFDEFLFVTEMDGEEIYSKNLFEGKQEDAKESSAGGLTTTETAETAGQLTLPSGECEGSAECGFSQEITEQEQEKDHEIRMYLKAVSTEGYRFEYELFYGKYTGSEEALDESTFQTTGKKTVYDKKGRRLELK